MSRQSRRSRAPSRGLAPATFEPAAFIELEPELRALLGAMGVHSQDVEDLIQEITTAAWSAMLAGRFRPDPSIPHRDAVLQWFKGIARRQVGVYRRKMRRRRREAECIGVMVPVTMQVPPPDESYAARETLGALIRIPATMRVAVVMYYLEGYTFAEIAALLQIPIGTADGRVRGGARHFIRAVKRRRSQTSRS